MSLPYVPLPKGDDPFYEYYTDNESKAQDADEITCPWCGYEFSDSWEASEGGVDTCDECGQHYVFAREVRVTYSAECLRVHGCALPPDHNSEGSST